MFFARGSLSPTRGLIIDGMFHGAALLVVYQLNTTETYGVCAALDSNLAHCALGATTSTHSHDYAHIVQHLLSIRSSAVYLLYVNTVFRMSNGISVAHSRIVVRPSSETW